jgi:hypothetical protein
VDPETERAILDLRAGLDEAGQVAFEADLRAALSLPADRRDRALGLVVRSWESRRELQQAPQGAPWLT